MPEITCLRCKKSVEESLDACPYCEERITGFQRTYSTKLIDAKYQIIDRLGMGGMGEIFKVRHIHLGEERVIKIMRANIASDEQALQRFLHEARTSTMIKHRNLAMLYDFSTLEDGSYYMVWEFIDGTNIQKWITANGPMPPRLALEIAIQTLHGLDHLHQMGLIHRDVSPENIMLSQDHQGRLLVKVIDFGIAKQLSDAAPGHGLTQTGMFLGKLKYASPEQAGFMPEGETLDGRSDLYSFGVVFYEMLSGRAPFISSNPQGYILKHATEKPQPISQVNPQVSLPPRLEEQVFIALQKDREHRHLSAADFAADLEELRDEIPPDEKFGLGDSKTFAGRTIPDRRGARSGARTGPTGPQTTLSEGEAPTVVDRPVLSGPQRTVVADVGGAPTVAQRPGIVPGIVPGTMVAPFPAPAEAPPKSRMPLYAAVAAVVVLLIAAGVFVALRQKPEEVVIKTTPTPVATVSPPPLAQGQAQVLLFANPYGELQEIVNTVTQKPVNITAPDGTGTPMRLDLPPGSYDLVVVRPGTDERSTVSVTLRAGDRIRKDVRFQPLDLDKVSDAILTTR